MKKRIVAIIALAVAAALAATEAIGYNIQSAEVVDVKNTFVESISSKYFDDQSHWSVASYSERLHEVSPSNGKGGKDRKVVEANVAIEYTVWGDHGESEPPRKEVRNFTAAASVKTQYKIFLLRGVITAMDDILVSEADGSDWWDESSKIFGAE